ncbi:UvrABC system protein A [Bacteroidia bacterium]|nr:UvrABC system protein A [Bacteroidia bacterium]
MAETYIEVYGAKSNNLKNIDIKIPHNKLIVITGLSGSGKSSLAFDTIYAEGQRRYLETFSAYARHFIANLTKPDVDKIEGLSPVIAIEQKTTVKNPRSTVGTITEIYDFLRLLYAKVADAYSPITGGKMVKYTEQQVCNLIVETFNKKQVSILAPIVKGRKGHYREIFESFFRQGFLKVRIDGEMQNIVPGMMLDRYKIHDIELVIDNIVIDEKNMQRLTNSVRTTIKQGKGSITVFDHSTSLYKFYSKNLVDPISGISFEEPEPNTFSFNSPYGYCPTCKGIGILTEIDLKKIIPDQNLSIKQNALAPLGTYKENWIFGKIKEIVNFFGYNIDTPIKNMSEATINAILYGTEDTKISTFKGIINFIESFKTDDNNIVQKWISNYVHQTECPECSGKRLKSESLQYKIDNKNIAEVSNFDLIALKQWIANIEKTLEKTNKLLSHEIINEIAKRIDFLLEVGLDYLSLSRSSGSLSGGESQRIRLATQIGSNLINVLYILDEPSIGLHQRDNHKLITALKKLRDIGNTVIVVEHDKDMILAADFVIDIGPGAGINGGNVTAIGSPKEILKQHSITCDYLNGTRSIPVPKTRRKSNGKEIVLKGATGHNLQNVDLTLPLGMYVCITGVSGSGKSSLINETLHPILSKHFYRSNKQPLPYKSITGIENIDKVIEIDQSPIGRTPRSNPATYVGVFDDIRKLFTALPDAKVRGYAAGRFSFNVKGGRCEECGGAGVKTIEMNFLPDVYVNCPVCNGKRYNRETLEVRFRGYSINDILNLTIDKAVVFFENVPHILRKIKTIQDVGLGYITLGQASTTLSGGEAQRVKLATELSKKDTGNTLYILDEPTTGLHFEDVKVLSDVLNKLVAKGNTVLVIEHNMDIIKQADYIIDVGPNAGRNGGHIIAQGTPEQIAKIKGNYTAEFLKNEL